MPLISKNTSFLSTDHLKSNILQYVTRGSFTSVIFQAVQFVLNLTGIAILGRLLTPNDYGIIGMVAAITGFVSILSEGGLSTATIQKQEISHEQVTALFWVNIGLGFSMSLFVVVISPLVAWFYDNPKLLLLTAVLGGNFALNGFGVQHRAILSRQMRYLALGLVTTAAQVIALIFAAFAALNGLGYWSLVLLLYVSSVVTVGGYWIACGWRPGTLRRNVGVRALVSFGAFISLNGVIYTAVKSLESLMVGRTAGPEQLGYYTRAGAIVQNPMQQLTGPLGAVAIPALSRIANEPERFRQAFILLCEIIAFTVVPGVTFLAVTSDWIIAILMGPRWSHLAPIAAAMAVGAFAAPLAAAGTWVLTANQKGKELFLWSIGNALFIAAAIIGGLPWGAMGVATAVAITGIFIRTPFLFWIVAKHTPVTQKDIYRAVIPPVAYVAGVTVLLWVFRHCVSFSNSVIGLSTVAAITLAAYMIPLFLFPRGKKALSQLHAIKCLFLTRQAIAK